MPGFALTIRLWKEWLARVWVLGPQLGTDAWIKNRRKDHKQCVQNFCENNPFRSVFRGFSRNALFHCLANFDNPEHWVIFPLQPEKLTLFNKKLYFSYPERWQRCALPSSEKVPFLIVFFFCSSIGTKLGWKRRRRGGGERESGV